MAKRIEIINEEGLLNLFNNHPYLMVFRKDDWADYITLLTHMYDLLEEEHTRTPYEVIRSLAINYYSQKQLQQIESKVTQFMTMSIAELGVLKDSHDQWGQRYLEATRSGKALLQLVESLLQERIKFSGTGAETLLSALNNVLLSQQQMTEEQALEHHKDKIKAYQKDLIKIKTHGVSHAELLPIPHSNEALFSQAEDAATAILSAMEDVKVAIENYRNSLAQNYFQQEDSVGQRLNTTVEFYQNLHLSKEYESYQGAKNLLSMLEGFSERFQSKNIDSMVKKTRDHALIDTEVIERSFLKRFTGLFQSTDLGIQEKILSQIKILQQQVQYSMSGPTLGISQTLKELFSEFIKNKEQIVEHFNQNLFSVQIPTDLDLRIPTPYSFPLQIEEQDYLLETSKVTEAETRALIEMLLRAEETTINQVLERLEAELRKHNSPKNSQTTSQSNPRTNPLTLLDYEIKAGLAEYYVLQEIELFAPHIFKNFLKTENLFLKTKNDELVIYDAPIYAYQLEGTYGAN